MRIFIIAILAILAGCSRSPVDTGDSGINDTTADNVYLIVGRDHTPTCGNRPMKVFACGSIITLLWQEDYPDSLIVPRNTLVTATWLMSCQGRDFPCELTDTSFESSCQGKDSIYVVSDTIWFVNLNY